jgi:sn-glycerol 3-phosphate transport system substrate-binding protein
VEEEIMRNGRIVILAALFMTAAALAGFCAGSAEKEAAPAQQQTIVFWSALGGNNGKILDDLVVQFNAAQSAVKVTNEFQGAYTDAEQKLLAGLAAGQVPELCMLEISRVPVFVTNKALQPLDDFAAGADGIDLKDFVQGLLAESRINGKLYSLPQSRSMPVFYYNKTAFKEVGLDPSKAPANWDELRAAAIKLTSADGQRVGFGIQIGNPWWYFQSAVESAGAEISRIVNGKAVPTFNEPKAVEALQRWYDLVNKDNAARIYPGTGLTTWEALQADFISGKTAMMYITTGWMGNILKNSQFEVGVGMLAAGPGGVRRIPTGGNGLVMLAKAPAAKQAAAWKFLKWITDSPQTAAWAKATGYMPLRISASLSPVLKDHIANNPAFQVAVDSMKYASPFPGIKMHPKTERTCDVMWERIFVGKEPIQKVVDETVKEIESLMKEM